MSHRYKTQEDLRNFSNLKKKKLHCMTSFKKPKISKVKKLQKAEKILHMT